ncbi:MAG: NTP transferase domain-containing protein [Planctomycetota bacterium]|jgi:choline kinase|nr:NTP transferase domain-containing protein [Planctomycetota bacterium]
MRFIILAAGQGTRMHPFTKTTSKCLMHLGHGETVAERMARVLREIDPKAEIIYVLGFMYKEIQAILPPYVEVIQNPFYAVSNSIASLWFARERLNAGLVLINGDIVLSRAALVEIAALDRPATIVLDSGKRENLDCGVIVEDRRVALMAKSFKTGYGEYTGVIQMDAQTAVAVRRQTEEMIEANDLNNWAEYSLIQLILSNDLYVGYHDIAGHEWAELDTLNDLITARRVQETEYAGPGKGKGRHG